MSRIPGASPISNDLEDIKHSGNPVYDETTAPDDAISEDVEGEDVPHDDDEVEEKVADLD